MSEVQTTEAGTPARWGLVTVQGLLDLSPYAPLEEPAEAVAERLVILAHLTMNRDVWAGDRLPRYWGAFTAAVQGAALSGSCVDWWCKFVATMSGVPLGASGLLDEKNRLVRPRLLDPPVDDMLVLRILDEWAVDLTDRTRMWVRNRRQGAASAVQVWDAAFGDPMGEN